jgi:hypothetical protein
MPQYQKQQIGGWEIRAEPSGKWRRIFKLFKLEAPYFVGNTINLKITLKRVKRLGTPIHASHTLVAYYPHNEGTDAEARIKRIPEFDVQQEQHSLEFESSTSLSKSGDMALYITSIRFIAPELRDGVERLPLFTTAVKQPDLVRWDIALIFLGALITLALGLLRVFPAWDFWLPGTK